MAPVLSFQALRPGDGQRSKDLPLSPEAEIEI
jgi:hypothetical protein